MMLMTWAVHDKDVTVTANIYFYFRERMVMHRVNVTHVVHTGCRSDSTEWPKIAVRTSGYIWPAANVRTYHMSCHVCNSNQNQPFALVPLGHTRCLRTFQQNCRSSTRTIPHWWVNKCAITIITTNKTSSGDPTYRQ